MFEPQDNYVLCEEEIDEGIKLVKDYRLLENA